VAQSETARREAFAALFSQLSPRLFRTALGILGNPHDAADALQDAGLKAYRYFGQLEHTEAAAAWLTRIVVNACYDQGKKRSRAVPIGLNLLDETLQAPPASEMDWELLQVLQALPEEQRATVALRFFQDLSISQVARVMNVPEGTVKSRLHTALAKLRLDLRRAEEAEHGTTKWR
jgi:RNA polymerase sigma-70 factor, ECF subfamily